MNKDSKYEVILSVVIFMLILYFLSQHTLFVKIGFGLGLLALISNTMTQWIVTLWRYLLKGLGIINSHLLLGLVFYVVLFPLSMIYRMLNRDILNIKGGKETYFTQRDHVYSKEDLDNPW